MSPSLSREAVIVVHSHLRWDFVWQRPQQLMSRFANEAQVIFVEEPVYALDIESPRFDVSIPAAGVTRVVPALPQSSANRFDEGARIVRTWLRRMVHTRAPVIQWFYTPMPAPVMLGALNERAVVYDCMDELSAFRHAPAELQERERTLLAAADVVFAGGCRLAEAKAQWHDNVHLFGCGVDASHFAQARRPEMAEPTDVASLPHPRLGYVGVIDERLDYTLLREIARANPDASIVMVGPRAKVQEAELPVEPNVHWLGQKAYRELPAYLKAFDVCLMPFARNAATAYINPTKTLEYLAAGKPVVSTAVPDVVRQFSAVVRVARSRNEFLDQCRVALGGDDAARRQAGIERAEHASWDAIVAQMRQLISAALRRSAESSIVA